MLENDYILFAIPGTEIVAYSFEMRVAIPSWQGRVSPVFDSARGLVLADVDNGQELGRSEFGIDPATPLARAREVAGLGANVLICGAISWPLETALTSAGVRVIAQTCGPVDDVLNAFLHGQLTNTNNTFLMPGCCGRGRRFQARRRGRGGRGRRKG